MMTTTLFRPVIFGRVQVEALTVDDYHRMMNARELPEDTSIELIHGFLARKDRSATGEDAMTIGQRHVVSVQKLMSLLTPLSAFNAYLQLQQPISLPPDNEPEPDASIIAGRLEDYLHRRPAPGEIHCVFEVADSSLRYDRTVKLGIYAEAKIPQYVIVNLVDDVIENYLFSESSTVSYSSPLVIHRGETLKLNVGKQTLEIAADAILP